MSHSTPALVTAVAQTHDLGRFTMGIEADAEELGLKPGMRIKELILCDLPNLHTLHGRSFTLEFLSIRNCPQLVIPKLESLAPHLIRLDASGVKRICWYGRVQ